MIAQTLKALDFFSKKICPYDCCFLHTKKGSGGASIHKIDELLPLEPFLTDLINRSSHTQPDPGQYPLINCLMLLLGTPEESTTPPVLFIAMMFELSQGIDEVFSIIKETVEKSNWLLHCDEEVKIYNTSRTSLFITCLLSPANAVCLNAKAVCLDANAVCLDANAVCLDRNVEEEEESDNGDKNTSLNLESLSLSDKSNVSLQDHVVERWTLIRKALLASIVGNK
jgi:hypothetical protein